MGEIFDLLRAERRARWFFLLLAQSVLGTGAGYVALLLIAYDRFESPWAIGLVLLADVLPAMLLGPVFGAAADRWSRRKCMVVADVLRLVAFGGIAAVDGPRSRRRCSRWRTPRPC
jgi:MFS family permease